MCDERVWLIAVLGTLVVALSGCSAALKSSSTATTLQRSAGHGATITCGVLAQQTPKAVERAVPLGQPIVVNLAKTGGPRTKVRITVDKAVFVATISDLFNHAGTFVPPKVFIAVQYSLSVLGPLPVTPSSDIGRFFGITGAIQDTILPAERIPRCGTVAASYAKAEALHSVYGDVPVGDTVRTLALYAIPGASKNLAWASRLLGIKVPLGRIARIAPVT